MSSVDRFPSRMNSAMELRMSPNRMPSVIAAAAPRALLALALAATLGGPVVAQTLQDDSQGAPRDAPVVPGVFDKELCVASIAKDTNFVTFMPPNLEDPNAPVSFAFKKVEGFKVGDLVKIKPAGAGAAQPTVTVLEAASAKCKRYAAK